MQSVIHVITGRDIKFQIFYTKTSTLEILKQPVHTIPGYLQWIVTWVIELQSALVHTTTQHNSST